MTYPGSAGFSPRLIPSHKTLINLLVVFKPDRYSCGAGLLGAASLFQQLRLCFVPRGFLAGIAV